MNHRYFQCQAAGAFLLPKIYKSHAVRQLGERQVINCIALHQGFKGLLKCAGGELPGDILMFYFTVFRFMFVFASVVMRALVTNWLVCEAQQ